MKRKIRVPFYFVLYLVVLVELLAVIIERDTNELELKARIREFETIQDSVISLYSLPIILTVQEETNWLITNRDSVHVLISVTNLQTPEEKANVRYFIKPISGEDENSYMVETDPATGSGHFYFKTNKTGTYSFGVYCILRRQLPKYLPEIILDGIFARIGNDFTAVSDTVYFKINAKRQLREYDKPGRG